MTAVERNIQTRRIKTFLRRFICNISQIMNKNDVKTKMNFIFLRFIEVWTQRVPCTVNVITMSLRKMKFILKYLHSPTISLDEPILDRRG